MRPTAFSLIELLVVTALIAVLSGLLVPAVARARLRGLDLGCLTNLRQWGVATHLFAMENQDLLPKDGALGGQSINEGWYVDLPRAIDVPAYHSRAWRTNALAPVERSLWICPKNPRRSNTHNLFHYCLNREVNGSGSAQQVRLGSIRAPEIVPWLFDNGRLSPIGNWDWVHTNLHSSGAQFLFLAGRVQWLPNRAYWDFKVNRGRTDNPELDWKP
jgi:hypothetical protein